MLLLQTTAAIRHAATSHADADLRTILATRLAQLAGSDCDVAAQVEFFIVEPTDSLDEVTGALGFSLLINPVDGSHFPDPAFTPSFEWADRHCGWTELTFVLSDDGPALVLLVPRDPTQAPAELVQMCEIFTTPRP
jgi:hypothetical protein